MNIRLLTLAALALVAASSRADVAVQEAVKVTGIIRQAAPSSPTGTNQWPLTISNILKALGIAGQNPKKLAYYYDGTSPGIIIAPAGLATGSATVPVVNLFQFGASSTVSWVGNQGQKPSLVSGNAAAGSALGTLAAAWHQERAHPKNRPLTTQTSVIASGTANGLGTVVTMTISTTGGL